MLGASFGASAKAALFFFLMFSLYIRVFCLHICLCPQMFVWFPRRPEEGIGSSGTRVSDICEPPCRYWNQASGALNCWAISLFLFFFLFSSALFSPVLSSPPLPFSSPPPLQDVTSLCISLNCPGMTLASPLPPPPPSLSLHFFFFLF